MSVAKTSTSIVVQDNDVTHLMYYLHCVTMGLGLNILEDDLVNYKNYRQLSCARTKLIFKSTLLFSPDELIDKLIFQDDDQIVTKTLANQFHKVSVACDIISLQQDVIIARKMQNTTSIMFFRSSWLKKNYTQPLLSLLVDSMSSTVISSSLPSSVPVALTQSSNLHQCICDRCGGQ
jgi:hypothetical protein